MIIHLKQGLPTKLESFHRVVEHSTVAQDFESVKLDLKQKRNLLRNVQIGAEI